MKKVMIVATLALTLLCTGCVSDEDREKCTKKSYLASVRTETLKMQKDIYSILKANCMDMVY